MQNEPGAALDGYERKVFSGKLERVNQTLVNLVVVLVPVKPLNIDTACRWDDPDQDGILPRRITEVFGIQPRHVAPRGSLSGQFIARLADDSPCNHAIRRGEGSDRNLKLLAVEMMGCREVMCSRGMKRSPPSSGFKRDTVIG